MPTQTPTTPASQPLDVAGAMPGSRAARIRGLRCRELRPARGARPELRLRRLLRAARGRLRPTAVVRAAARPRRRSTARPPASGATSSCSPSSAPPARGLAVGRTPLIARRPARRRASASTDCWLKDDTRNPTLSFKDRVVAVATARAVEFGARHARLRVAPAISPARPRPPRPRPACARSCFVPADLEPAKIDHALAYGATVVPIDGTYDDVNRLSPGGRRRARLGVRQRQPAAVLRGGQQDARVRDRRGPRLAAARTSSSRRSRRARMFTKVAKRLRRAGRASAWSSAKPVRFVGGQAAGLRAGRDGVRRRATDVIQPVRSAGHDRPLARDRQPGRRALRARAGPRDGRVDRVGRPTRRPPAAIRRGGASRASTPRRPAA